MTCGRLGVGVELLLNLTSSQPLGARLHFPYGCGPTNLIRWSDHLLDPVQMETVRYISAVYCVTKYNTSSGMHLLPWEKCFNLFLFVLLITGQSRFFAWFHVQNWLKEGVRILHNCPVAQTVWPLRDQMTARTGHWQPPPGDKSTTSWFMFCTESTNPPSLSEWKTSWPPSSNHETSWEGGWGLFWF